ncbi:MAG: hypothetical protein R6W86_11190 [Marinobacter sp.]|uniref:hypothetical protein n=1 Tax=Marinobacter sp. TaxID=50741 RepID=UPI00396D3C32
MILTIRSVVLLVAFSGLEGCSSTFFAAMDAVGGGGLCNYSAEGGRSLIQGDGYTFTFGGYCDYWEGKIDNYGANATVKCIGQYEDGDYTRAMYAEPGEDTGWKDVGPMVNQTVSFSCLYWSSEAEVVEENAHQRLEGKYLDGKYYYRVRNMIAHKATSTCSVENSHEEVLTKATLKRNEATDWVGIEEGSFLWGCY